MFFLQQQVAAVHQQQSFVSATAKFARCSNLTALHLTPTHELLYEQPKLGSQGRLLDRVELTDILQQQQRAFATAATAKGRVPESAECECVEQHC